VYQIQRIFARWVLVVRPEQQLAAQIWGTVCSVALYPAIWNGIDSSAPLHDHTEWNALVDWLLQPFAICVEAGEVVHGELLCVGC